VKLLGKSIKNDNSHVYIWVFIMNIYLQIESSMLEMGDKIKKVDVNFNKSENF